MSRKRHHKGRHKKKSRNKRRDERLNKHSVKGRAVAKSGKRVDEQEEGRNRNNWNTQNVQNNSDINDKNGDRGDNVRTTVFRDIVLLIVSLLHGTLFFILAGKLINIIANPSLLELSELTFCYCLFFRIFQTHILAAIKYDDKWEIKPYDFVMIFATSLFEFLLFNSGDLEFEFMKIILVMVFAVFGILGYAISFFRTKRGYKGKDLKTEQTLQFGNMIFIFLIGVSQLLGFIYRNKVVCNLNDTSEISGNLR